MTTQQLEQELAIIRRSLDQLQMRVDHLSSELGLIRATQAAGGPPFRYVDLMGLGKEIWQQIDVDAYINAERGSWA